MEWNKIYLKNNNSALYNTNCNQPNLIQLLKNASLGGLLVFLQVIEVKDKKGLFSIEIVLTHFFVPSFCCSHVDACSDWVGDGYDGEQNGGGSGNPDVFFIL